MTRGQSVWAVAIIFGLLIIFCVNSAWALTGFARKYQTTCITCHEAPPRLNKDGEAFRINGYRFIDDETKVKQEPFELGDEAYQRLWPQAIWPGKAPKYSPLSILTTWNLEYHNDPQPDPITGLDLPEISFVMPHEIELAWADSLGEHMSFYGDIRFIQEDYGGDDLASWGMLKGWIQFEDLFGLENKLNLQLGSVGMHTIGLFNARNEMGMPFQPYLMNGVRMPSLQKLDYTGNYSVEDVYVYTGNTFVIQNQTGIEVNGFTRHLYYYGGIVNGKIKNPAGSEPEDSLFFLGAGSNSDTKDFYAGLNLKIGGLGFDGTTGNEVEVGLQTEGTDGSLQPSGNSQFWRDNSLIISLFGYQGEGRVTIERWEDITDKSKATGYSVDYYEDDFRRFGVGLLQRYNDFTISAGYMWGENDNPYGDLSNNKVKTESWFIESHYFVYPWLVPFVRYEGVDFNGLPSTAPDDPDPDLDEELLVLDGEEDRAILTVGAKIQIRPNVLLNIEGYYYTEDADFNYALDKSVFAILRAGF